MSEPESSSDTDNEGSNLTSSQSQGDSEDDHEIFAGLSAWFSESVESGRIEDWRSYGGEVTDVETAQFLFSENCESPDTLRIYKNDQFRNQHVGVIHALFIDECLQKKWLDAVPIGLYYLPPKQVQEMLEENCCFKWQVEDKKNGPKEVHQLQKPKPKKVVHHTKREPKKVIHQWYTNNKSNDMQSEGMDGAGDGDSDRGRRNQSDAAESCRPSSIHCEPSQGHVDMTTRPSADLEDNVSVPETRERRQTSESTARVRVELATCDLMVRRPKDEQWSAVTNNARTPVCAEWLDHLVGNHNLYLNMP